MGNVGVVERDLEYVAVEAAELELKGQVLESSGLERTGSSHDQIPTGRNFEKLRVPKWIVASAFADQPDFASD